MATELDDQAQTRMAMAALFAALAKALGEQSPAVPTAFAKTIEERYQKLRDSGAPLAATLETLRWVLEMM